MASRSQIKAGEAFIVLRAVDQTQAVLRDVQSRMMRMSQRVTAAGRALFTTGAAGLGLLIKPLTDAANAQERLNAMSVVFGDDAKGMISTLTDLARRTATFKGEMYEAGTSIGAMLKGFGFSGDRLIEMTTDLVAAARDLGSVRNRTFAEMSERFISAMTGSTVVVDQFGINLKAAAINQELLAMGLSVTSASATDAQKAMARYNIILKTLGKLGMLGDAERTSRDLANAWKGLIADVKEVSTVIGQALLPAATKIVNATRDIMGRVVNWIRANSGLVISYTKIMLAVTGVGAALIAVGLSLKLIAFAVGGFAIAIKLVMAAVLALKAVMAAVALNPILLATVVALGIAVYLLRDQFAQLFSYLGKAWNETIGYMGQALAKGQLMMALRILWETVVLTFTKIRNFIMDGADYVSRFWAVAISNMMVNFENFAAQLKGIWAATWESMMKVVQVAAKIFQKITSLVGSESDRRTGDALLARANELVAKAQRDRQRAAEAASKSEEDRLNEQDKRERAINEIFEERKRLREESLAEQQAAIDAIKTEIEEAEKLEFVPPELRKFGEMPIGGGLPQAAMETAGAGPQALQRGSVEATRQAMQNAQATKRAENQRDEIIDNTADTASAIQDLIAEIGAV